MSNSEQGKPTLNTDNFVTLQQISRLMDNNQKQLDSTRYTQSRATTQLQCLTYILPGVVIVVISLFSGMLAGNAFNGSFFAEFIIFLCTIILLGTLYFVIFQSVPQSLAVAIPRTVKRLQCRFFPHTLPETSGEADNKKDTKHQLEENAEGITTVEPELEPDKDVENVENEEEQTEPCVEDESETPVVSKAPETPAENKCIEDDITSSTKTEEDESAGAKPSTYTPLDMDEIERRKAAFLAKQAAEHRANVEENLKYIAAIMPGLIPDHEIEQLCQQIVAWADDVKYIPQIEIHPCQASKKIDFRHFMWNVSKRLGQQHFCVEIRGNFLKSLVPVMFKDNDPSTLKNLKDNPNVGNIIIDEPEGDDLSYHLERDLKAKEEYKKRKK